MTSYFIEKEAKIYKMATSILLKFLTLKWNISRTIWRIEVGDGSVFCIFHALSFELNFFSDRRFPLSGAFFSKIVQQAAHYHYDLFSVAVLFKYFNNMYTMNLIN